MADTPLKSVGEHQFWTEDGGTTWTVLSAGRTPEVVATNYCDKVYPQSGYNSMNQGGQVSFSGNRIICVGDPKQAMLLSKIHQ